MTTALYACAAIQIFIAALNLSLPIVLGWRSALASLPALIREVFYVHAFYLSLTLVGMGLFTFVFANAMVEHQPQAAAIARFAGVFWAVRVLIQLSYYSPMHYRGKAKETAIHVVLLLVYGGMSVVYFAA